MDHTSGNEASLEKDFTPPKKSPPDRNFRSIVIYKYYRGLEIGVKPLLTIGIHPNSISFFSLLASGLSGIFFSKGSFSTAGLLLLASGILDTIDGTIARLANKPTKFGALFDSSCDRYSEFFVFFGILTFFRHDWVFFVILFALMGSIMVSYIKARSQSLGKTISVGLMQRPERIIILAFGSFINTGFQYFIPESENLILIFTLFILAFFTNLTAFRRLYQARKDLL